MASSVTSRRERLPLHIQKQLARDIEANGGIAYFEGHDNQNLCQLLDQRVEEEDNPYGVRGQPIRARLRKKVYRWQVLNREGRYISEVLNPWRIWQFSSRRMKNNNTPKRSPATPQQHLGRHAKNSPAISDISLSACDSESSISAFSGEQEGEPKASNKPCQAAAPIQEVVVDKNKDKKTAARISPTNNLLIMSNPAPDQAAVVAATARSTMKRKSHWDDIAAKARK